MFFEGYGDHRDLHVRTHSFPTRRSSDLRERGPSGTNANARLYPAAAHWRFTLSLNDGKSYDPPETGSPFCKRSSRVCSMALSSANWCKDKSPNAFSMKAARCGNLLCTISRPFAVSATLVTRLSRSEEHTSE